MPLRIPDVKSEMIFNHRGLALIAVWSYWGVVLKVACYSKNALDECAAIVHFARLQNSEGYD